MSGAVLIGCVCGRAGSGPTGGAFNARSHTHTHTHTHSLTHSHRSYGRRIQSKIVKRCPGGIDCMPTAEQAMMRMLQVGVWCAWCRVVDVVQVGVCCWLARCATWLRRVMLAALLAQVFAGCHAEACLVGMVVSRRVVGHGGRVWAVGGGRPHAGGR